MEKFVFFNMCNEDEDTMLAMVSPDGSYKELSDYESTEGFEKVSIEAARTAVRDWIIECVEYCDSPSESRDMRKFVRAKIKIIAPFIQSAFEKGKATYEFDTTCTDYYDDDDDWGCDDGEMYTFNVYAVDDPKELWFMDLEESLSVDKKRFFESVLRLNEESI